MRHTEHNEAHYTPIFRSVVQKILAQTGACAYFPFKFTTKTCTCASLSQKFWTTDLKIGVEQTKEILSMPHKHEHTNKPFEFTVQGTTIIITMADYKDEAPKNGQ